jgi:hypothetical protein
MLWLARVLLCFLTMSSTISSEFQSLEDVLVCFVQIRQCCLWDCLTLRGKTLSNSFAQNVKNSTIQGPLDLKVGIPFF